MDIGPWELRIYFAGYEKDKDGSKTLHLHGEPVCHYGAVSNSGSVRVRVMSELKKLDGLRRFLGGVTKPGCVG